MLIWQTQEPQQLKLSASIEMLRQHDLGMFTRCPQAKCAQLLKMCANHRGQELKKELTLVGSSDITVAITEPQTGRKEVTLPVKVSQP